MNLLDWKCKHGFYLSGRSTANPFYLLHIVLKKLSLADRILVLTKRPATVKKEIIVPFERPRKEEIRHSAKIHSIKATIIYVFTGGKG